MADDGTLHSFEGRFWLPGDRHRGYGRIDVDGSGARVHLVDTNLISWDETGPQGPEALDVLHGETLGGQPLTLLGVYPTGWRLEGMGRDAGDVVDAVVDVLLRGIHVLRVDDLRAVSVGVRLHGLRDLLLGGVVDRRLLQPAGNRRFAADTLEIDLDGALLTLMATRSGGIYEGGLREERKVDASAGLRFDGPRRFDEIDTDVRTLQDLVTFATRRRSYAASVVLTVDEGRHHTVDVLRAAVPHVLDERQVYAHALNLADLEDPGAAVARWYRLRDEVGPVWNVFFAALDRPESLLEDRLLGLLAFSEGYHRARHDTPPLTRDQQKAAEKAVKGALEDKAVRAVYRMALSHANQQTQGERLLFLTRRADELLSGWWYVEPESFSRRLVHTRNWLVHWGDRTKHAATTAGDMADLVKALVVTLYANLLLDLGLPGEAATQAISSGWRLDDPPAILELDEE